MYHIIVITNFITIIIKVTIISTSSSSLATLYYYHHRCCYHVCILLGQALSIRTDLINEAYALELRKLQDAVTPFDSVEAKKIICRELGIKEVSEVFLSLSDAPIASASIGQVYKGTLKNGQVVAVKVQVRLLLLMNMILVMVITKMILVTVKTIVVMAITYNMR